jgi:hypothetical protein
MKNGFSATRSRLNSSIKSLAGLSVNFAGIIRQLVAERCRKECGAEDGAADEDAKRLRQEDYGLPPEGSCIT